MFHVPRVDIVLCKEDEQDEMSLPDWKAFEIAVAKFLAALDPDAKVSHNVKILDKDTGLPRQRDVWIEAKICKLFPAKILVSCKHEKRKLSQQDVDHFFGEFRSSGADLGVIYSYSGYTKPAIKKAKALNISCCRLYVNQPPDLPESLVFLSYCSVPRTYVGLPEGVDPEWGLSTWDELFALVVGESTVLDEICKAYAKYEEQALEKMKEGLRFPPEWTGGILQFYNDTGVPPIEVKVGAVWRIFEGKFEAVLLSGS